MRIRNARCLYLDKKTKQGVAIRALAANERMVNMQGISTRQIRALVMVIASALAAGAGVIIAPLFYSNPFIGGHVRKLWLY